MHGTANIKKIPNLVSERPSLDTESIAFTKRLHSSNIEHLESSGNYTYYPFNIQQFPHSPTQ
jgi:hypothetical protein